MKLNIFLFSISFFLLILTILPAIKLIAEVYYNIKINSKFEFTFIQKIDTPETLPFIFGENEIDIVYKDLQHDDKVKFNNTIYMKGTVMVKNNSNNIFILKKERGIQIDESGNIYGDVRVILVKEKENDTSFITIIANVTENSPIIENGILYEGTKAKEKQQFVLFKIFPDGEMEESRFSYKKQSSYLETKLAQTVSPVGFGYYSDLSASYATFLVPLFYPVGLFIAGIILFFISIISLIKPIFR